MVHISHPSLNGVALKFLPTVLLNYIGNKQLETEFLKRNRILKLILKFYIFKLFSDKNILVSK